MGTLYLIATPIGNLEDITLRALRLLKMVDLIACEDTRHTQKLLNHFDIHTKTVSYHEHNEESRAIELIARLKEGERIALVSDAGTPAISDPGFRFVRAAIEAGARVESVPGAVAFVTALAASGLPTDQIYFGGFLPAKTQARRARLKSLRALTATLIFYESPHRLAATLKDAFEVLGERACVIARELTKLHEEFSRGRLSELSEKFSNAPQARGEFVLLIDREKIDCASAAAEKELVDRSFPIADLDQKLVALMATFEREGLDRRAALKRAARELGLTRAEAYRRLISVRGLE